MVKSVTSFGRSGLSDWLIQRFTAVILLAYTVCVGSFLVVNPDLNFVQWQQYFDSMAMKVFSTLALLSLVAHTWIGLWGVSTDYLTVRLMGDKATALRLVFQAGYSLALLVFLVWGFAIFWGN